MESVDKLGLLGADGRPLSAHITRVLQKLVPRLHRAFPTLRDDLQVTEILEEAGQRIADHEARRGTVERLYGYAWVTLRSVASSRARRSAGRLACAMLDSEESERILASKTSDVWTAEQIERQVLFHEVLAGLTAEEQLICIWKKAGLSSREIAAYRGTSVGSVDVVFCRAKDKIRKALGLDGDPQDPRPGMPPVRSVRQ